ncbi:MAG TPA: M28 family peptidase, partial [Acidobacteriota bacterium]
MEAAQHIEIARLKSHVEFLAGDLLEGREAGSRGYDIAALYVASQFAQLGLAPAGVNGTFLQPVPLRRATVVPQESSLTLLRENEKEPLQYETHYLMSDDYLRTEASITAEAVFAGFGVTAPELNYDSYAGLDVKNKIVVLLSGAPASFPASQRAHYSSSYVKEKNAVAHGAAGILSVRTPVDEKRQSWDRIVRQSKLSGFRWLDQQGQPNKVFPEIKGTALLHRSAAEKLFSGAEQNLNEVFDSIDKNAIRGFALPLSVSIKKTTRHESTEDPNVVAILIGADPKLRNEYIVYSAHLDHIGITDPVDGDQINNGAYDNATGIAALIEIARAFTLLPLKPKR